MTLKKCTQSRLRTIWGPALIKNGGPIITFMIFFMIATSAFCIFISVDQNKVSRICVSCPTFLKIHQFGGPFSIGGPGLQPLKTLPKYGTERTWN